MEKINLKTTTQNRIDEYYYLLFYRPNELITRVDRYSIFMYFTEYNKEGKPKTIEEFLFYPSKFGIEEIENNIDFAFENTKNNLIYRLEQLRKFGNPWWHYDVEYILTPNNWRLNKKVKNA